MELIIKPTSKCNFNCTFCSAYGMDIKHPKHGIEVHPKIKDLILKLKPSSLIITGGEPLTVLPDYYYNLHEILPVNISITSNLKDFYFNPKKWVELFNEKWFGVATSFNYGNGRMWNCNTVYTEDMFIRVIDLYKKYVNKSISFISVINDENENDAIKHVYLAKQINSIVKLNNAIGVGKSNMTFPKYKMFKIYHEIIDNGLEFYESNCSERKTSRCPRCINNRCENRIRCCYVDNNDELHVGICDGQISLPNELSIDEIYSNNISKYNMDYINDECKFCELCRLCNNCHNNRYAAKNDPLYCIEMKKIKNDIINHGWIL